MTDITITPELRDYLASDATLTTLAPGGVWEDPSPQGPSSPIVVIGYETAVTQHCGGGRAVTEFYYAVKVVGAASAIAAIRAAALRINALLDMGPIVPHGLAGYSVLTSKCTEPISYPDPEPVTGIRFEHRGGHYRIDVEAV